MALFFPRGPTVLLQCVLSIDFRYWGFYRLDFNDLRRNITFIDKVLNSRVKRYIALKTAATGSDILVNRSEVCLASCCVCAEKENSMCLCAIEESSQSLPAKDMQKYNPLPLPSCAREYNLLSKREMNEMLSRFCL